MKIAISNLNRLIQKHLYPLFTIKLVQNVVESSEGGIEYESFSNVNNEYETDKNNLKTTKNIMLETNELIKFNDDENVECEATFINRVGKALGKYNSLHNIKYRTPTEFTGKKYHESNYVT